MKKLLVALVALAALVFYTNTTTTVATAPAVNQPQVELANTSPDDSFYDHSVAPRVK